MASYYYLISSLPMLKTQGEAPMDYAAFLAMCQTAVGSGVYQTLETLTVDADKGPLLSQWASFYQALRRELTYQRCVKLGRPCPVPSDREAAITQAVTAAVNADDPLEGERILLYGYAMKLRLLERQQGFRYEAGKRAFDGLMDHIRQQVVSL